jgi:GntR family transcriptional regulator
VPTTVSLDPTSDRPAYQQVADVLRRRIVGGDAGPGDRLPSEAQLMHEFGISRTTARLAYGVLRAEGLTDAARGRGVFVRDRRDVQRVAAERYRDAVRRAGAGAPADGPQTAFTRDHGVDWADYRLDREFRQGPAPPDVAALLDVEEGTPVLARRFVFHAAGQPKQMSVSYLLEADVAGTPVADPANEPWPGGTIAQLASLGIAVERIEESVRARMPTPEERRALRIGQGVPVLTVTRRMLAADRPVEAAVDIVMPADRFVLDYTIDLR